MFRFRQLPANSRMRILVAASLAITAHTGLMGLHVEREPASLPQVDLPRSVSVFLGRKSQEISTETVQETVRNRQPVQEKTTGTQRQSEKQVYELEPVMLKKAPDATVPSKAPAADIKAAVKADAGKKSTEPAEPAELSDLFENTESDTVKTADADNSGDMPETRTISEQEGVSQAGTIQTAYPRYQLNAPPAYPDLSRKRGQEGTVILRVLVNEKGGVDALEVEISSSFALLDRAAEKAVSAWLFEPGRQGRETLRMWVRVPVTFKLQQ